LGKADFLDLSGEAWGCTVKSPADDVYIIALTPERLGSLRDTNNRLKVNIVHVLKPPLQDKELSG
jgi:hypothetical protein